MIQSQLTQSQLIREERNPKEVFRDIRNYLAGQFIGSTRDEALLDEVLKCLFCKMFIDLGYVNNLRQDADSLSTAKQVRSIFAHVRSNYPEIYTADTEILLNPEAIVRVFDACTFPLVDAYSDPVGDAFEVFIGNETRGKSGQFFTPRSAADLLVEIVNPQPHETVIDPAIGVGGFLTSVLRRHIAAGLDRNALASVSSRLFGIDKDCYLAKLALVHVALIAGAKPTIVCADSIALSDGEKSIKDWIPQEGFDVLLANPPYGARIVAANPEVLQMFDLAKKWHFDKATERWFPSKDVRSQVSPQVLFVERCLSLVKDGGRLGMVLPESTISNKSTRFVVQYLMERSHITAIIGLPESLFKTSGKGGTHTKTCLLIAQKDEKKYQGKTTIFMAEAKWCGQDSRGRRIPHNDLPVIGKNIRLYREMHAIDTSPLGFLIAEQDIRNFVLSPRYYDPKTDQELAALAATHELVRFEELVKEGTLNVTTGDELGKLSYGTGEIPFVRTSDLSNWEIKIDTKHGVDREIYQRLKKKQDVQPYDIFMVRDGTYLIGTCAIVTPAECEILYQSHIYKIRVNANARGITPFLLLAILTSPPLQRQIRAKQFTQDIIDSLGERINELVLPIPIDKQKRELIDGLVRQVIERRTEARELATQARELVGSTSGSSFSLRNGA